MNNIWFLNQAAYTPATGPHIRHYTFARYLKGYAWQGTVFAAAELHHTGRRIEISKGSMHYYNSEGVPFVFIKTINYKKNGLTRTIGFAKYYLNVIKACKQYGKEQGAPTIIYASTLFPTTVMAGLKLAKFFNVPCICETRDIWPEELINAGKMSRFNLIGILLRKLNKHLYQKADRLVFTMEGGLDYLREMKWTTDAGGRIDPEKVAHINNGVDLQSFDEAKQRYVYQDEDLDNSKLFKVVYTGSIRLMNNMVLLTEVAKRLRVQNVDDVRFILYGAGDYVEELNRIIEDEQLGNIVIKGYVDKKYIPGIVTRSDVNFISVQSRDFFRYGSSLNKMFDYLAAARPIISTFPMGHSIINHYQVGIEVEDGSVQGIVNAILELKSMDREKYQSYCTNARKAAFDYDYIYLTKRLMNEVLEPCLSNSNS